MTAYVIVDNHIIHDGPYEAYINAIGETVEQFNGKYLVRGGEIIFSDSEWNPPRLVVIAFPNRDKAMAWVNSKELAPLHEMRKRYAESQMIVIEGV